MNNDFNLDKIIDSTILQMFENRIKSIINKNINNIIKENSKKNNYTSDDILHHSICSIIDILNDQKIIFTDDIHEIITNNIYNYFPNDKEKYTSDIIINHINEKVINIINLSLKNKFVNDHKHNCKYRKNPINIVFEVDNYKIKDKRYKTKCKHGNIKRNDTKI